MRSKILLGLVVAGASLASLTAGCGGGDDSGTGGATAASSTASTTVSSTGEVSSSTVGPSSTSTGMGDGNDNFDQAQPIGTDNTPVSGSLDPVETDYDYYKFTGKAGQVILAYVIAKRATMDGFASGYPDTVITLFDGAKTQIAENDDMIPRFSQDSEIYTVLPADGDYYLRITEFCTWYTDKGNTCPPGQQDVSNSSDYQMAIAELDGASMGTTLEGATDIDDTMPANAPAITYAPGQNAGDYYLSVAEGTFASATDVDVFKFTPPADATVSQGRQTAYFTLYPNGPDGNGSTTLPGNVWITSAATPAVKIAQIDGTKIDPTFGLDMDAPLTFGQDYLLYVQHQPTGMPGGNPFYFVSHYVGGSNPAEAEAATGQNDTTMMAEAMTQAMATGGAPGFFIAGDLKAYPDKDVFSFTNASVNATDKILATCAGQTIGSGVRGLKLTILDANGADSGNATESADAAASLGDMGVAVPAANTTLYLQVEQTVTPDPTITGTYYQCGVVFLTP